MKLPILKKLFNKRKLTPTYLLTLILRPDLVKAVVYEELSGNITVFGKGIQILDNPIDEISIEQLLQACDKAIGKAEENLPEHVETQKTIFGIIDSWQVNGKIKKEHLDKLKRIKTDLGLLPVGFIVITDAISYALQKQEGAPINAVLVEIGKKIFTVSLLRASRIAESRTVSINEESFPVLLEKTLKGFTNFEVLPSRIILVDEESDLESIKQESINFPWTKHLPFLHVPRIEVLPSHFDEQSLVLGVAKELGFSLTEASAKKEEVVRKENKVEEKEESGRELAFGFMREQDVEKKAAPQAEEEMKGKTILNLKKYLFLLPFRNFPKLPSFPSPKIPFSRRIVFLPIALILLLVLFLFSYTFLVRAEVRIFVSPKTVVLEKVITIDPDIKNNGDEDRIKGEKISIVKEGEREISTTGKKEVGEQAKGEVTIYNKSSDSRTLSKGTVIASSNDLKFTLDESVTVASASGGVDAFSTTSPSTAKVKITASSIGEESNLPSQTTFTVGTLSEGIVAAKNDSTFSGGSKREVQVVARADQDSLLEELFSQFREEAKGELLDKDTDIRVIDIVSEKTVERRFDKKIDEEADKLKLSLKVEFEALGFRDEIIKGLFEKSLKEEVGDEGFILSDEGIEFSISKQEKARDASIRATVSGKGNFVPTFDKEKLKEEISFKSKTHAESYIHSLQNVTDAEIIIFPPLPLISTTIPFRWENISISISQED